VSTISFSQTVKLDGFITDSKALGLEMANVMAVNQGTKADGYAITNDKGKFVLNLKPNATYTIKISYLGMQNKKSSDHCSRKHNQNNCSRRSGID
jgi:hypothetical protein